MNSSDCFRSCTVTLATLLTVLALSVPGRADPTFGSFKFINNTRQDAYDLETVWSGTGGTLAGCKVTATTGVGTPACVAIQNMVNLDWQSGDFLPPGASVSFKFDSAYGAEFASGEWTDRFGATIGPAMPTPEPTTIVLLGTILCGMAARFSRRPPSRGANKLRRVVRANLYSLERGYPIPDTCNFTIGYQSPRMSPTFPKTQGNVGFIRCGSVRFQ